MGKETILLYNFREEKEQEVRKVCLQLGIKAKHIEPEQYAIPIGMLFIMKEPTKAKLGKKETNMVFWQKEKQGIQGEMMIMDGFSEERMERFFARMKKIGIPTIELKAIVTEHNKTWSGVQLYQELKKEHEIFSKKEV